jgi:hypothetical protein
LLFVVSTGTLFFVVKKIRDSQAQIDSAVFWVFFMLGMVVISIFPGIAIYVSDWLGIDSPANFVFLCIIFLLLLKVFSLSLQISKLQYQIQQLTQIISLKESQPGSPRQFQNGNMSD